MEEKTMRKISEIEKEIGKNIILFSYEPTKQELEGYGKTEEIDIWNYGDKIIADYDDDESEWYELEEGERGYAVGISKKEAKLLKAGAEIEKILCGFVGGKSEGAVKEVISIGDYTFNVTCNRDPDTLRYVVELNYYDEEVMHQDYSCFTAEEIADDIYTALEDKKVVDIVE
jgi:hypothetical protein